ncbi:hypothetical protein E2C01_062121 [Portunus trituberculatus]|uniref:Uncharacterized protein n=1 Tax=Portunus trituberculatus TaxID=210409 RepID=A0A5B7HH55_PORTR|nr:hypothetical protein [Portunus trituberculatus]
MGEEEEEEEEVAGEKNDDHEEEEPAANHCCVFTSCDLNKGADWFRSLCPPPLSLKKFYPASAAVHLPSLYMPPKRPAMLPSIAKKTTKSLTLEVKLDIIHRHEARKLKALLPTMA